MRDEGASVRANLGDVAGHKAVGCEFGLAIVGEIETNIDGHAAVWESRNQGRPAHRG